ncbi:hypothetical protein COCNU_scaffold004050G000020 [Cocos nucifera]|nr:hypothetical protein [Cocos nucifera]
MGVGLAKASRWEEKGKGRSWEREEGVERRGHESLTIQDWRSFGPTSRSHSSWGSSNFEVPLACRGFGLSMANGGKRRETGKRLDSGIDLTPKQGAKA